MKFLLLIQVIITALLLSFGATSAKATHVESCSVVSGCPTGDGAVGVNFTGLQPSDLAAGSFTVTMTGNGSTPSCSTIPCQCTYSGGHADNSQSCTAFYDSVANNIECLVEHLDCRNKPFDVSVSAPAGYSCTPAVSQVNPDNCFLNPDITVSCTPPVCVPDGSCSAPPPACGQTTTGVDNCGNTCSKTGPACTVTIGGTITNAANSPISGVSVTIARGDGATQTATTNSSGVFSNSGFITSGDTYAVRAPSVPVTFNAISYVGRSPSSNYEGQTAGGSPDCGQNCNFIYTEPGTLAVLCSVSPTSAAIGESVTWSAAVSGGQSPYSYSWTGSDSLSGKTGNPAAVSYSTSGTKTGSVTVTDSLSQTATSTNSCSVNIPPPGGVSCNMSASPSSGVAPLNTFISVGLTGDTSPWPNKRSQWDLDGDGTYELEDTALSHNATYNTTTTPKFRMVDAPGSSNVLAQCQTPVTITTVECTGANESCTTSLGPDCTIRSSAQNLWCQQVTSNPNAFCQYCPPPPVSSCFWPAPINNSPTVTILEDGVHVEVSYTYESDSGGGGLLPQTSPLAFLPDPLEAVIKSLTKLLDVKKVFALSLPNIELLRSDTLGFIYNRGGTKLGTQFNNHGVSFDESPPYNSLQGNILYYQLEVDNGTTKIPSQTVAVGIVSGITERSRSCFVEASPKITSASLVSANATSITFQLTYKVGPASYQICGCSPTGCSVQNPPPYLKITHSAGIGYVPWTGGTGKCTRPDRVCGGDVCWESTYKANYLIGLPPYSPPSPTPTPTPPPPCTGPYCPPSPTPPPPLLGTFTIAGYAADYCEDLNNIGSASFSGSTTQGSAPAPIAPNLTGSYSSTTNREPFVKIDWITPPPPTPPPPPCTPPYCPPPPTPPPPPLGQISRVFREADVRWEGVSLGREVDIVAGSSVTSKIIEDLTRVPAGTYYYGAELFQAGWCGHVYSAQLPFVWVPPTKITGRVFEDNNFNGCLVGATPYQGAQLTVNPGALQKDTDAQGTAVFDQLSFDTDYSISLTGGIRGQVIGIRIGGDSGVWLHGTSTSISSLFVPPAQKVDFCVNTVSAWIKTQFGDVHSNTKILTPGGP